jgi:hypothetical protein
MQIYVHRDGQQLGPFSEAELKAQLGSGTISWQDLAWWEGQAGWVPIEQTSLAASAPPPAPAAGSIAAPSPVAAPTISGAPVPAGERTSGMAIAALVCGLSAVIIGITFIPAIILGHLSLGEIKRNPGMQGRGLAITGLVFGYLFPLLFVAIVVISVILALGQTVHGVFSTINSQLQETQGS